MEPTPVPRTPVSQRIAGAAESKESEAVRLEAAATGGGHSSPRVAPDPTPVGSDPKYASMMANALTDKTVLSVIRGSTSTDGDDDEYESEEEPRSTTDQTTKPIDRQSIYPSNHVYIRPIYESVT